ncbi:MAG: DUF2236 domain-containing protein [Bacteroidetes bacterium]|nr:MAG: DUF2236 domain-containing protein [Bacteroidota bacterium]
MTSINLDHYRQITDPLADGALRRLVEEKGPAEARNLFDRLIRQIEMPIESLPASLQEYWSATDRLPDWADWAQIRQANALFLDHGPKFLIFLYYKSLPLLYTDARGAKVLIRTGRLTHQADKQEIFTRRIAETGQFLLTVMAPEALQPGGPGIRAIQKIRLIHAAIRYFVQHDAAWDAEAWGLPINQEDMALTLMTFSVALTDALDTFQIKEEPARLEAYLHTWTAIGHVLGIDVDLLPKNRLEARALMEYILLRQSAPSEDGKLLMQALIRFAHAITPEEFHNIPALLTRHLIGPDRAAMLGVAPPVGCLGLALPHFIRVAFNLGERLEDRVQQPLRVFLDMLSQQVMQRMVRYFDEYKQRNFEIPKGLREVWMPEAGAD